MRIQHNIASMNAYRNYNNNVSAVNKNLEKLSSGYRINRAGDDAAGLAISEKMRAQIKGLEAAQKNVKDGISFVKTTEGAMQEIQDMLGRMKYLATQSANGTYENQVDRDNIQAEVDALLEEINRIADSANFNGIHMLNGKDAKQATNGGAEISYEATFDETELSGIGLDNVKFEGLTGDIKSIDFVVDTGASTGVDAAVTAALDDSGKLTITLAQAGAGGDAFADLVAAGGDVATMIQDAIDTAAGSEPKLEGVKFSGDVTTATLDSATAGTVSGTVGDANATDGADEAEGPTFTLKDGVDLGDFDVEDIDVSGLKGITEESTIQLHYNGTDKKLEAIIGGKTYASEEFTDNAGTLTGEITLSTDDEADGTIKVTLVATTTSIGADQGGEITAAEVGTVTPPEGSSSGGTFTPSVNAGDKKVPDWTPTPAQAGYFNLQLQIGDTPDAFNKMGLSIQSMKTDSLGITGLNVASARNAGVAIDVIKDAINTVSQVRGQLGAYQNRLEHTSNNLSVMTENIQDAESTIRDTDIADEMMSYTKNNILVQSAQAMLAQANQIPQGVLQLLG